MERTTAPGVAIEQWGEGDLDLLRRINAREMMEHLGGPETEAQILDRHRRYVEREGPGAVCTRTRPSTTRRPTRSAASSASPCWAPATSSTRRVT